MPGLYFTVAGAIIGKRERLLKESRSAREATVEA